MYVVSFTGVYVERRLKVRPELDDPVALRRSRKRSRSRSSRFLVKPTIVMIC